MEIKINHNGTEIVFTDVPDSCLDHAIEGMKKLYDIVTNDEGQSPVKDIVTHTQMTSGHSHKKESFEIRDRIPNNVVDIESLNVKQAVMENALVRCPNCGQAHCLVVKDTNLFLMRKNYEKNEFEVVSVNNPNDIENIMCREGKYTEYFQDLQNAEEMTDIKNFAVDNNTDLFCPVCHSSNMFINWKDAWENPLHFFETENMCEICGGEVSMSVAKDGCNNGICNVCKAEVVNGKPVPKQ